MVIGKSFAWGHLGKTGGHTTWELFQLFPEEIDYADSLGDEQQHTPFPDRLARIEGKELALNIRRLPAWTLSYHMHRSRFGDYPDYEPIAMVSPYEMALSDAADQHIASFTGGGKIAIDHWLRTEHLSEDFLVFVSRFVEVSSEKQTEILGFGQKNTGAYNREVDHWFSAAHIALMYRSNPEWAAVEERVYGQTLADDAKPARIPSPVAPAAKTESSIQRLLARVPSRRSRTR